MICVVCGKEGVAYRGMCSSCASESVRIEFPDKIEYSECPKCSAFRVNKKWEYNDPRGALLKQLISLITLPDRSFSLSDPVLERIDDQISSLSVSVNSIDGFSFERSSRIYMRVTHESCPVCDRKTGSYYEAILQIRFEDSGNMEIMDDLLIELNRIPDQGDPNQFISKYVQLPEGIDIYLGSKKLGEKMLKHISSSYPGSRHNSKKLAGRKEGKDFYRFTFSYRIFNPRRGTIFQFNNRILCLKRVEKDRLLFSEGPDESEVTVSFQDLVRRGYSVLKTEPDIQKMMVVSNESGNSTLMDLDTYHTVVIKNELPLREAVFSKYNDSLFLVE